MSHGEYELCPDKRGGTCKKDQDKEKIIKTFDKVAMFFAIIMPATTIPQIYKTYSTHNVDGISLWMWVLYCIAVVPWLIYGILHHAKPIIVLNIFWLVAQIVMIISIILYR